MAEDGAPPPCLEAHLDGRRIRDLESFHDLCAWALGFPAYYGRNWDAWIDCLTYVDDPVARMTARHVARGGTFILVLDGAAELGTRCPEVVRDLREMVAFVNARRVEQGEAPVLALREA
jgi:RNAse (barnase) inhibitor barstar